MKTQQLSVKQVDAKLAPWQAARHFFQPSIGWVKTLRQTLGMTSAQLAFRLGVNRSRIIAIEHAETQGTLKLKTLGQVAEALNCDLVYAFVPRKPLSNILEDRANEVAKRHLDQVSHSMALENQQTSNIAREEILKTETTRLLNGPLKYLWQEW